MDCRFYVSQLCLYDEKKEVNVTVENVGSCLACNIMNSSCSDQHWKGLCCCSKFGFGCCTLKKMWVSSSFWSSFGYSTTIVDLFCCNCHKTEFWNHRQALLNIFRNCHHWILALYLLMIFKSISTFNVCYTDLHVYWVYIACWKYSWLKIQ